MAAHDFVEQHKGALYGIESIKWEPVCPSRSVCMSCAALSSFDASKWMVAVPGHSVGRVIGRGGSGLKDIESSSEARLSTLTERGADIAVFAVGGSSPACELAALLVLLEVNADDSGRPAETGVTFPLYETPESTMAPLVNGTVAQAGACVNLQFSVENDAVRLWGSVCDVVKGFVLIRRDVCRGPGARDFGVCELQVYPAQIGGIIGPGGRHIRRIEDECQCKVVIPPHDSASQGPVPVIVVSAKGGRSACEAAQKVAEGFTNQRLQITFCAFAGAEPPAMTEDELAEVRLDTFIASTVRGGCTAGELVTALEFAKTADHFGRVRRAFFAYAESGSAGGVASSVKWLREMLSVWESRRPDVGASVAEALFFPSEDNLRRMVTYIDRATSSVDVCVFNITNDALANALLDAHRRGVTVRLISDNECAQNLGSDVQRLANAGICCTLDASDAHMHNKFAIMDGRVLMTGSFNWTRGASKENKENVIITSDARLSELYTIEFERLWKEFENNRLQNGMTAK